MARARRTREEVWRERVEIRGPDECWPWLGQIDPDGYGRFKAEGEPLAFLAHRVAFAIANGVEPEGVVRHSCDTPWCQNGAHLLDGTQAENVADMNARGRGWTPRGETHGRAKLTEEQVRELRADRAAGASLVALGQKYKISPATAGDCAQRRTWSHVT